MDHPDFIVISFMVNSNLVWKWLKFVYPGICFQCYVEMRDYEEAVRWLEMGKKTPVVSQDVSKTTSSRENFWV